MRDLLSRIDEADIHYWMTVTTAVFFVWRAGVSDDRGSLFLLFGAAYLLIHAHGRRILAAIKERDKENP